MDLEKDVYAEGCWQLDNNGKVIKLIEISLLPKNNMEYVDGIEYLHTEDVALLLGVTSSRVRQLLLKGRLSGKRMGDRYRGYWLITPENVEAFKQIRRGPGKPRKAE